ncbi:hypothetical protein GDO86_018727 [Hymenochirus boettgeri]|uniref:G-protein coupled receptors family 1 profile domain-containing protein n=1 Tax=Hymenochirus boettgeri TaxID=247094 RepID=A0A8T2IE50_9PIPI|nr:hypothetical protein GDO86_018727 [Hymenochirus boettgeri]
MTLLGIFSLSSNLQSPTAKTPMYFFLGTLACLDMSYSSVTTPRMLYDLPKQVRIISLQDCLTQIYFFFGFGSSEVILLAVMSYDRYIAVCKPLHYKLIMPHKTCVLMISGVICGGLMNSLLHTLFLLKLTFCVSKPLQSFFCDSPQLLLVSCSDTFINVLLILFSGIFFGGVFFALTFSPYIIILNTIMKMSKAMRSKAFSTCSSHLTVVFIFYGSIYFNYFRPNFDYHFGENRVGSVFYAVINPC